MNYDYRLDLPALYKQLGYKGGKIPTLTELNNVPMQVKLSWGSGTLSLYVTIKRGIPNAPRKSSAHRVFVLCPKCGKSLPAGRLHQHVGTGTCK